MGGFGGSAGPAMEVEGEQVAIEADAVAAALNDADSVVIIPGYGMAVAQAQQADEYGALPKSESSLLAYLPASILGRNDRTMKWHNKLELREKHVCLHMSAQPVVPIDSPPLQALAHIHTTSLPYAERDITQKLLESVASPANKKDKGAM